MDNYETREELSHLVGEVVKVEFTYGVRETYEGEPRRVMEDIKVEGVAKVFTHTWVMHPTVDDMITTPGTRVSAEAVVTTYHGGRKYSLDNITNVKVIR